MTVPPGPVSTPAPATAGDAAPSAALGQAAAAATAGSAGDTEPTPLGDEPDPSAPAPASDLAAAPAKPPAVSRLPSNQSRRRSSRARPPSPSRPRFRRARCRRAGRPGAEADARTGGGGDHGPGEPRAAQIAVQVGAFATRKEADTLAKKLSGRGYAVYVMNPMGDGKPVYRVRVGNYSTADEAKSVSARLTQQEKLKPWITR